MAGKALNSRYDIFTIATWFIWRGHEDEESRDAEPITLLKLMKLLYYAEGCSLALGNGSLSQTNSKDGSMVLLSAVCGKSTTKTQGICHIQKSRTCPL